MQPTLLGRHDRQFNLAAAGGGDAAHSHHSGPPGDALHQAQAHTGSTRVQSVASVRSCAAHSCQGAAVKGKGPSMQAAAATPAAQCSHVPEEEPIPGVAARGRRCASWTVAFPLAFQEWKDANSSHDPHTARTTAETGEHPAQHTHCRALAASSLLGVCCVAKCDEHRHAAAQAHAVPNSTTI